jgi:hypothetical protein
LDKSKAAGFLTPQRLVIVPTQSELAPQSVLLARLRRVRPNFGIQHLPVNQDRWPQGQLKEMLLRWTRRERPGSVESDVGHAELLRDLLVAGG